MVIEVKRNCLQLEKCGFCLRKPPNVKDNRRGPRSLAGQAGRERADKCVFKAQWPTWKTTHSTYICSRGELAVQNQVNKRQMRLLRGGRRTGAGLVKGTRGRGRTISVKGHGACVAKQSTGADTRAQKAKQNIPMKNW